MHQTDSFGDATHWIVVQNDVARAVLLIAAEFELSKSSAAEFLSSLVSSDSAMRKPKIAKVRISVCVRADARAPMCARG